MLFRPPSADLWVASPSLPALPHHPFPSSPHSVFSFVFSSRPPFLLSQHRKHQCVRSTSTGHQHSDSCGFHKGNKLSFSIFPTFILNGCRLRPKTCSIFIRVFNHLFFNNVKITSYIPTFIPLEWVSVPCCF